MSEQNRDLIIERKMAEYQREWDAKGVPSSRTTVIDTEREPIPMSTDIPASAFNFEEKDGNTTYEIVGHFNPNASENLLQKIIRMLREEKSLQ